MVWKNVRLGLALSLALSGGVGSVALMPPVAIAAQSTVNGLALTPNGERLQLAIALQGSGQPQVFFSQQGNAWVGDITNAQLQLAPGQSAMRQDNPVPGVNYIEARQLDRDSVRVRIEGAAGPIEGLLAQRSPEQLVFDFSAPILPTQSPTVASAPAPAANNTGVLGAIPDAAPAAAAPAVTAPVAPTPARAPLMDITQLRPITPPPANPPANTTTESPVAAAPPSAATQAPGVASAPETPSFEAVPNTAVTETAPTESAPTVVAQAPAVAVPPPPAHMAALPRQATGAVPPPVGDIAIGNINLAPRPVDLGSQETVSLTLKDAPVGDVLALLVRRAGLNVVLNDVAATDTISLDVQDSPLQDVFNSVLRLNQLQGERIGRTVFIGSTLPGVQETNMQTFRLNQSTVVDVVGVLDALAADGAPLAGMQFVPDERTNSITAVGTPNQMAIASAQIAQLDVRQRQVMIHVKLVAVELNDGETISTMLGGASGNFALAGEGGESVGQNNQFGAGPGQAATGGGPQNLGTLIGPLTNAANPIPTLLFNTQNRLQNALAIRLESVLTNVSTKVLADPRVIVSDGGSSELNIGPEVITNVIQSTDPATGVTSVEFGKGTAGVVVKIENVRIDDNGFVTLDISPSVSSIRETVAQPTAIITLLNERSLTTERVRLRDGQTLIMAGLIRDEDRVDVARVPLLSEIPILGTLFRRTSTTNVREEALLMVTPSILNDDAYLQPVSYTP